VRQKRSKPKSNWIATLVLGVLIIIGIVSFLNQQFGSRQVHYNNIKSISLADERIGRFTLGQSIKEFISPELDSTLNTFSTYSTGDGLKVVIQQPDERVIRIGYSHSDTNYSTTEGIKIGDNRNDIISKYGSSYYERNEQGNSIIGYKDDNKGWTLEFVLSDDKVNSIRLDLANMK
jgi:hypothetical protein